MSDALTEAFRKVDLTKVPSPCHVLHRGLLEQNLRILRTVMDRSGAKVLLALKGFAQFSEAKLITKYLAGTTASGIHEALLGREEFGGEVHAYSPAFKDEEFADLLRVADHISFNSPTQWKRHKAAAQAAGRKLSFGLRVNPEHAEVDVELYNPCAAGSRLGTLRSEIKSAADLDGLEGLHFHTMCQQGSDVLERTVAAFEAKFGEFIPQMKWVNFGGGHHITREGYDLERLIRVITGFRQRWGQHIQVYLEPGEAIGIGTGVLVGTVLDLVHNGVDIAIIDVSATCHMPDTLEMPYRADIMDADLPGKLPHTYRLGSVTCLAGDVIGDYSFAAPLKIGQRLVFMDMSHYTFVKNTTFNGVPLPAIASFDPASGQTQVVRRFGYADYKNRLS
ncbi:MAG: carboxynorspermidine decarboxylase [Verrucomicrobia bacterium]|nr:carboxynorspermidine decarboxylase [Verrucomicrobiota bacterium]